jgi:hypothetical protein
MNPEYNKVHVKMGKMSKAVDASKIEVDGTPLSQVVNELRALKKAYADSVEAMSELLEKNTLVPNDKPVVLNVNNKLIQGKLTHVFPATNKPIQFMTVEDGKLKFRKEVGIL